MAHTSVLLQESVRELSLKTGARILDATFGGGGHSRLIAQAIGKDGVLVAIDADRHAFRDAIVAELASVTRFVPVVGNFRDVAPALEGAGIACGTLDGALFDLGISSDQLESSGRGFSFLRDEPLAMTLGADPSASVVTADVVVNRWSEEHLADILRGFGEERFAGRIARAIAMRRRDTPIRSSLDLAEVVARAVPARYRIGRIHPATKTFQAIRMAVNDELGAIEHGVRGVVPWLAPGGRLAVISFHSVEDRLVKRLTRELEKSEIVTRCARRPITPTQNELERNPRARSAKLRSFERSTLPITTSENP
jgi:16S rRNA (cytosine1402-N4)-methyltransferase